jgi:hypothetical protein
MDEKTAVIVETANKQRLKYEADIKLLEEKENLSKLINKFDILNHKLRINSKINTDEDISKLKLELETLKEEVNKQRVFVAELQRKQKSIFSGGKTHKKRPKTTTKTHKKRHIKKRPITHKKHPKRRRPTTRKIDLKTK